MDALSCLGRGGERLELDIMTRGKWEIIAPNCYFLADLTAPDDFTRLEQYVRFPRPDVTRMVEGCGAN